MHALEDTYLRGMLADPVFKYDTQLEVARMVLASRGTEDEYVRYSEEHRRAAAYVLGTPYTGPGMTWPR